MDTLRFITDTNHPAISCITGVLGQQFYNPFPRHVAAIKSNLRNLTSRSRHGPRYKARRSLQLTCYTDSYYAAGTEKRRSVAGLLALASSQPVAWASARQATVTHSSTEAEFIVPNTGARTLTCISSLVKD